MNSFTKILVISGSMLIVMVVTYVAIVANHSHLNFPEAFSAFLYWGSIFGGMPILLFCIGMTLIAYLMKKIDKKYHNESLESKLR